VALVDINCKLLRDGIGGGGGGDDREGVTVEIADYTRDATRVETKVFVFIFSQKLSLFATKYDKESRINGKFI
jgi:hypothetical protein